MKEIEDFILVVLWGIVISCSVLGLSLGDDFVFRILNLQPPKPNAYITFTASVILGILLTAYQIWRKNTRKTNTEVSSAMMTQLPFTPLEYIPSGQNTILYFLLSIPLLIALFNIYMMTVPSNNIFDGLFALDMNNLHKERIDCLKRIGSCLLIGAFMYWSLRSQVKYCILEKGFIYKIEPYSKSSIANKLVPWNLVEKAVMETVPRMGNSYACKLIFYGRSPNYFREIGLVAITPWKTITYDLNYIPRADIAKIKDAISRRVLLEYIEK
jgi:hypothetical protein